MLHGKYRNPLHTVPAALDPADAAAVALAERRHGSRVPVIKSAKIVVGEGGIQGVFDCLVLDESPGGLLVDIGALVSLPEQVTVRMNGGASYVARRCWSVGTKLGLEFIGAQVMTGETALRMMKIADVLHNQGVGQAVATLRTARFFDHLELRRAAEEAEVAWKRLESVLTGRQTI
jgi:hypothetical protein